MRTLFLQAPSFDGFDGGAGSRYQARREIRSFWYPTWLAQPAALVPDSKLIDAPAARLTLADVVRDARNYDLAVLHTSTPSFASDVAVVEALKAANPRLKAGFVGAKVAVAPQASLEQSRGRRLRRRQRVRLHHQGSRRGARLAQPSPAVLPRRCRCDQAQPAARDARKHGRTALRHAGLQARPRDRELFHRLSEASLRVALHRPRLQVALHLLPVAADRRRPSLPHAQRRPRGGGDPLGQGGASRRSRSSSSTTTPSPTTGRAPKRSRASSASSASPGRATPRPTCRATTLKVMRDNGLRLLLVGYESGNQQILHNIKKGMRIDVARRFTKDCHELGITIHGTFILGLPGETPRDDRGDHPLRHGDQPAHDPGVARRALSRAPSSTARRSSTAGSTQTHAELVDDERRADGAAALSASDPHRDLPVGRGVLPPLLLPRAEDRRRSSARWCAAREMMKRRLREGRRVLLLPARTAGAGALNRLVITADDFGLSEPVNAAIEEAHRRGILSAASLMVGAPAAADAVERARRAAEPARRAACRPRRWHAGQPRGAHIRRWSTRNGYLPQRPAALRRALTFSPAVRRQIDAGDRRAIRGVSGNRAAARPCQCAPAFPSASGRRRRDHPRSAGATA